MLPMGWNQIRQARVSGTGMNQQQQHQMSYGQMVPNQQQFNIYRQPAPLMQPQQQQFYPVPPHQMMGNFGMPNPQMMMIHNSGKPPEPEGPPPPSPPAPLPSSDPTPPPPPDDSQWWIAEMKNLPSDHHRQELERMVNEKWFHSMNTSQQIECWQHKLHLINTKKKVSGNPNQINPSPDVSAPSQNKPVYEAAPQVNDLELNLRKAREEETSIRQQVATFEKQYIDWKKQFDDWKDKHQSHPNQEQFAQYEKQWMTWQQQMSDQRKDFQNSLDVILNRIRNLEQRRVAQNPPNLLQMGDSGRVYPGNAPNQNFFPPQNKADPRFQYGNHSNRNSQYPEQNFQQQNRPRFSPNNSANPNRGFGERIPGQANRPRPLLPGPSQNRQQMNRRDSNNSSENQHWQNKQFHDDGNYANDYNENEWDGDYQDQSGCDSNNNNYNQNQDYSDFGAGNDAWDDSLSLLPSQAPNRFNERNQRQPQRFPNQRFSAPGVNPRFRGPRPHGFDQDKVSRLTRPPRPRFSTKPLMDIPIRAPRPPLQGVNSKLMSLSNESIGNDSKKGKESDSQNFNKPGIHGLLRPRGPRPVNVRGNSGNPRAIRPLLEHDKPFSSQQNRFPHPQSAGSRIRGNDSLEDKHGESMDTTVQSKKEDENDTSQKSSIQTEASSARDDNVPNNKRFSSSGPTKSETQDPDRKGEAKRTGDGGLQSETTHKHGRDAPSKASQQTGDSNRKEPALGKESLRRRNSHGREPPHGREPLRGRDLARGRGRPLRGKGRGRDPIGLRHRHYFEDGLYDEWDIMGHYDDDFPLEEELYFERLRELELMREHELLREFPPERKQMPQRQRVEENPHVKAATSGDKAGVNATAILKKAKELSNIDVENLLSAVKSIKSSTSSVTHADATNKNSTANMSDSIGESGIPSTSAMKGKEAAILAQEKRFEQLAKKYDTALLHRQNEERLLEEEILAASTLGLHDADLLLDPLLDVGGAMRDPLMRRNLLSSLRERDPLRDPVVRDPLFDPLLRESYLEREMLRQQIREMREREEQRQNEDNIRDMELMEALTKPIVQAQKIVETIDYSHGFKKEEGKEEPRKRSPPPDYQRRHSPPPPDYPRSERDLMFRDEMMKGREPPMTERRFYDHRPPGPMRGPPDFPPRMRHPDMPLPPRFQMDDRMVDERRRFEPTPPRPYDPNSAVIVADDVIHNSEALQKHWDWLGKERESVERRRNSMERRRSSLEKSRQSREREEERNDRERSLERLRRMERDLKEKERILNEREMRLKSPPRRKARDMRSRMEWKPEGIAVRRSRSPIRRRSRERRFRSRSRSPSPQRRRSPDRGRGRSPDRGRGRSPFRGRRRFTSPSGDSKPRPPPMPPQVKLEPVYVRVEDLLNDPARQRRPKRIVIILRGLPGSGKSHIAKLIRDHETARGVTPRVLGLDDYFMVENEKFEKDPDTQKIVKRKVHEYEYDAAMETSYHNSLFKSFKKTLEDGYFNFVIIDAINDRVSQFTDFWTVAKKNFFEVYVAEILGDVHVCAKRNIHKRTLDAIQLLALSWEQTPQHMIRLDVKQMLQDSEIQEVEMGDVSDEGDAEDNSNKEKMTMEQLAGIPQSKWELMEANERLDKLDGIKKKKLTSSQQDMAEFLSVTDDYVQRSSAPGKKRVRWADIEEKSEQRRLRDVGFVVGKTDWSRLVDGDSHANAALNRTKFI